MYLGRVHRFVFYALSLFVFVFGGLVQYLVGLSNTVITFGITIFLWAYYLFYVWATRKVAWNKIVFLGLLLAAYIILIGIVRERSPVLILLYLVFPLLPVGVFLFSHISYKRDFLDKYRVFRLFYWIALGQLPILWVQKNFYELLIRFNNSGQAIASYDFMFGSFFIKSDHSLGVFLLLVTSVILFDKDIQRRGVPFPLLTTLYLGLTLFLTESNISKLVFVLMVSGAWLGPFYQRYRRTLFFKVAVVGFVIAIGVIGYQIREEPFIRRRLGGQLEQQLSSERALKFYEETTAKRFQIVLVAAHHLETKWWGDGPYSYFDIRTGKFRQSRHFTQLIWAYFDLGLVGLFLVLTLLFSLGAYLDVRAGIPYLLFMGVLLLYAFYTTLLSDIAMLLSMFALYNRRMHQEAAQIPENTN